MKTFRQILSYKGRIVLFTANAAIGLRHERVAERHSVPVIHTRGWADPYGPLGTWSRLHASREPGMLSCDQMRYTRGYVIQATDLVWVGSTGDEQIERGLRLRYEAAMRVCQTEDVRRWVLKEDEL
jgi:hypothetical protein